MNAEQTEWLPSKRENRIQVALKYMQVKSARPEEYNGIIRLQSTWLGKFYRRYLKRYTYIRLIAHWLWRNGYPLYLNYFALILCPKKEDRWRRIIKLSHLAKKRRLAIKTVSCEAVVETPMPETPSGEDLSYLISPHDRYVFPEIYIATLKSVLVYGGTNLVMAGNDVICHDLNDFERDYTSEELHGRILIDSKHSRIRWLMHDKFPGFLPVAASFVDACAPNYAHWMTEVLPRVAMFCSQAEYKHVPLIVNDGLHSNILESLNAFAGSDREIYLLPIGQAIAVEKLYMTSVAGYVPFEPRTVEIKGHSQGMFSSTAFEKIRNNEFVSSSSAPSDWPKKIYIRRPTGGRCVTNGVEIEQMLVSVGFTSVNPERLSFLEQVKLFSNAEVVVASSGSALANIIFCSSAAKIYILISKYPGTAYWYWQNIARASGKTITYVFGEISENDARGIHADFSVDRDKLISVIEGEK